MFSMANTCRQESSMNQQSLRLADSISRRTFIGGSDARVIMGADEPALIRLWREKRGEAGPADLSGKLIGQLGTGAVFEAKFMLHWSFSEEAAAEKYMAQVQHNMWVTHSRVAVLSIITGGGKWVEITIPMDPLYLTVLVSAVKKFWRCVQSGEVPHLINAEPPRPRIPAI